MSIHSEKIAIVGILNLTPDSYVDGGKWDTADKLIAKAKEFIADGADILDLGAESSGPGSTDVSVEEEKKRLIPMLTALKRALPDAVISIDTYKAAIARETLDAGASMMNDVTAGRGDPHMFEVIAAANCRYVMMYSKDASARTTLEQRSYDDVLATIHTFLAERREAAISAGIRAPQIIVDPGLGHFISGKSEHSWHVLRHLERFSDLGPVYVSPSRKSFTAGKAKLPVSERLPGTLAATAIAVEHGARFIRTHDVKETKQLLMSMGF